MLIPFSLPSVDTDFFAVLLSEPLATFVFLLLFTWLLALFSPHTWLITKLLSLSFVSDLLPLLVRLFTGVF